MGSRAGSRGPGRPLSHRQSSRFSLRTRHIIILGSFAMAVSCLLLLSGSYSNSPAEHSDALSVASSLRLPYRRTLSQKGEKTSDVRSTLAEQHETPGVLSAVKVEQSSGRPEQGNGKGNPPKKSTGKTNTMVDVSGFGTTSSSSSQTITSKLKGVGRQQGLLGGRLSLGSLAPPRGNLSRIGDERQNKKASGRLNRRGQVAQLPVLHEMEDEELLWRASFISLRDPSRRPGPRRIAFLFSFNTELFFAPLWAKFFEKHEGRFSVYLHGSESNIDKSSLPPMFRDRFVPIETQRSPGGDPFPHMYAVDAARRLMANALLDMSNEWFLIVCDLCVPLHNFDYVYDYFSSAPNRNFVPNQAPNWKNGLDRFIAPCFEPLVVQEQWRKGGPWMGLTRRMALNLVADIKYYDKFASCCQPAKRGSTEPCFPLEHYMATVLPILGALGSSHVQPEEVTNWSTVFEDWWTEPWAGRPFVYNESFVSEKLIKTMRRCHLGNLCHLQGAHFDPVTLPKLMNMTSVLGF